MESGDQAADKINAIDNHIEEKKQEVVDIIETKVDNLKQVAQDKIAERRKEDKDNA